MAAYSIAEHIHSLELKTYEKPYNCDGCRVEGFGARYRCEECNVDLHKQCMFPYLEATHEFFRGYKFHFYNYPPGNYKLICDGCGKFVDGFVYHCREKDWNLHPCCINLSNHLHVDGFDFWLTNGVKYECIWCKRRTVNNGAVKTVGWSYVSDCRKYVFHVRCAAEMMIQRWKSGGGSSSGSVSHSENSPGLAVAKVENQLPVGRLNKHSLKDSKYWRIGMVLLKTIAVIFFGGDKMSIFDSIADLFQ